MKDKRKFKRFPVELDAKYSLEINQKEWKTCKVVNVGREGMGIEVHLQEKFQTGSLLKIEVLIPPRDEPVKAVGILRWIKDLVEEKCFLGGVQFTEIDPEDTWMLLDYAYNQWLGNQKM